MNVFFEIHSGLLREGPGNEECTERALRLIPELPKEPRILDVGCGPGTPTIQLAKLTGGYVTGADTHQPFLDRLTSRAVEEGLAGHMSAVNAPMTELPFPDGIFDLIWSEGAIYIMGFENGLRSWKRLLKPGGYIAVSECTWLKPDPPDELREFWNEGYPAMQTIEANLAIIRDCGYHDLGHFTLPESAWLDSYYAPIEARLATLREKYAGNPEALAVLDAEAFEIELYRKYSAWYGYVFYVMREKA